MDDLRDSFSKLKKGIKRRLRGRKRKTDNPGASGSEGMIGPSSSLPRPESPVTTGSDLEREGDESDADDEDVGPSVVPDEKKSDRKSTAFASAKLLLRGVRDSADAFPPLKSVAGGLCFLLDNSEVWPSSLTLPTTLIGGTAYEGKQTSDRISGTADQSTWRTALSTRF